MSDDLYGYIPESYLCIDCGYNTGPRRPTGSSRSKLSPSRRLGASKTGPSL